MSAKDLHTWFPEPTLVAAGSESLSITPLTLGQLGPMCRAIAPFAADLPEADNAGKIARLVGAHGEQFIEALAVATGKPADWLAALPLDVAASIAVAVIRVNLDFFVARVAPQAAALGQATAAIGAA